MIEQNSRFNALFSTVKRGLKTLFTSVKIRIIFF
jgi:hypothetical protein